MMANGASWNYADNNGADWPSVDTSPKTNECGETNQSPIELFSKGNAGFTYKVFTEDADMFTKDYTNQKAANPKFNGHTNQVNLDIATTTNQFTSKIASNIFGADTVWEGQQFHFHAGSEHTVDGVRQDLEMHTVHYPKKSNEFIAAAMGIMFSVEDYTADLSWAEREVIDNFFESLQWTDATEAGPTVDMVTYGSLMEMVDNNKRWIYKGSVITPPCARFVYWNVLSTIYPVSAKHLALFKEQLNRGEEGELDARGNWRKETAATPEHNVIYLDGAGEVIQGSGNDGTGVGSA